MSLKNTVCLLIAIICAANVGCYSCMQGGCGSGCVAGYGGQVYDECCASCGVPCAPECGVADASCGCPTCGVAEVPACGVAEPGCEIPACGIADPCCGPSCGTPVGGSCPLSNCSVIRRLRRAFSGCAGCGPNAYWGDWQSYPPCDCEPCDPYGNHIGGTYGTPHVRRGRLAREQLQQELHFAEEPDMTYH